MSCMNENGIHCACAARDDVMFEDLNNMFDMRSKDHGQKGKRCKNQAGAGQDHPANPPNGRQGDDILVGHRQGITECS